MQRPVSNKQEVVIPAQAGIQGFHEEGARSAPLPFNDLDSRLRGNDVVYLALAVSCRPYSCRFIVT